MSYKNKQKDNACKAAYKKTARGKLINKISCRKRYLKNKKIMHNLKSNGCAICGYNGCVAALDFHHVNSEDKKFNLMMSGLTHTNEKIAKELNKCILLCKNCHAKIHYEESD